MAFTALPPTTPKLEKPLPLLPSSPTLTNPDYILPSSGLPNVSSPPRLTRRPPSPSYLRDSGDESPRTAAGMGKKERLGLMSRKMMLLRSRTASGGNVPRSAHDMANKNSPTQGSSDSDFIASSPILQDVGNLAPEQPEFLRLPGSGRRNSTSGGSSSSDISGVTAFLARYGKSDSAASDEETVYEHGSGPTPATYEQPADGASDVDAEADAERRKQQQEEYNSAILSKRAEQILANAKKRLNVMEGNLRGARDLVAPLTAANLKRATSLGSAQYFPSYSRRYMANGYDYEEQSQQPARTLQYQASSPTMGRDYTSHARGFSETELPDRPYTSLDHTQYAASRVMRTNHESLTAQGLRSTRSHDSLGSSGVGHGVGRERPLHARDSPDSSHLEPLAEADETRRSMRDGGDAASANNGLGIYRPSSRTSDLREQMSSLKGKISSLKERAREESLRRQSQSNLRNASLFNNALNNAPEFYYATSSGQSSPVAGTAPVNDRTSGSGSPTSANFPRTSGESPAPVQGSRNAFAEQAKNHEQSGVQHAHVMEITPSSNTSAARYQSRRPKEIVTQPATVHSRTTSGTAIIESAKSRYSHHQYNGSQEMPRAFVDDRDNDYLGVASPGLSNEHYTSSPPSRASADIDDDGAPSEDGTSVYEDAQRDQASPEIAHEDRADAFDYQHFFVHSAMGSFSKSRRGSNSSEASMSSSGTAKAPYQAGDHHAEYDGSMWPPSTPETPEKLREIERNLHKRAFSDESVSTMNSYATADEDPSSPIAESDHGISPVSPPVGRNNRKYSASNIYSNPRTTSRTKSRPSTAIVRASLRRDSSSERADSGVGLPRRSASSADAGQPGGLPGSMTPKPSKTTRNQQSRSTNTPPSSPRVVVRQDPATIAVNALLDPNGKALGLRNKAVLFSVVESLRKVVHQLQEEDETQYVSRDLRGRLDEARFALEGRGEG